MEEKIKKVDYFKYLGICFDKYLTWAIHTNKIIELQNIV